jgi:hypothetical protein
MAKPVGEQKLQNRSSQIERSPTLSRSMKLIFLALSLILPVHAQAPGVDIFEQSRKGLRAEERAIGDQIEDLVEEGKMPSLEVIEEGLKSPTPLALELPAPKNEELAPTSIAELAKRSGYRIGWGYLCQNCDQWHVNLAGGYAVTADGVLSTCAHVIKRDNTKIRKGGLIAVDHLGKVYPVTAILANDEKMDGALVKIDAKTIPLPLNDLVSPGDAAFCLSRPLDQGGYFSQGIVNRFYWNSSERGTDPRSIKSLRALKLNVSSRWAPGSSGSAVLDSKGNAIGHVALINTMGKNKSKDDSRPKPTLITLHTATPARAIMALARREAPEG